MPRGIVSAEFFFNRLRLEGIDEGLISRQKKEPDELGGLLALVILKLLSSLTRKATLQLRVETD
jgi:hypothetical protein